jgi:hypothetical protein
VRAGPFPDHITFPTIAFLTAPAATSAGIDACSESRGSGNVIWNASPPWVINSTYAAV